MAGIIRNNIEKWLRRTLRYVFDHPYFRDYFSDEEQEKFITRGAAVIDFVVSIATFVVMIWFFHRMLGLIGFEKTVVTLLVVVAFLLRNFLELSGITHSPRR